MAIERLKSGHYTVRVKSRGKRITVGTFDTRVEAALAQENYREMGKPFTDLMPKEQRQTFKDIIDDKFLMEYEDTPLFKFRVPAFLLKLKGKIGR